MIAARTLLRARLYTMTLLIRSYISNDPMNTKTLMQRIRNLTWRNRIKFLSIIELCYAAHRKRVMTTHNLLTRKFKCFREPRAELLKKLCVPT